MRPRGRPVRPRRPRIGTWLRLLAAGTVVIAALAVGLAEEGVSKRHRSQRHPQPVAHRARRPHGPTQRRRPGPTLQQIMAKGNAKIRELARLGLPIYCGGRKGRLVAFTFDDGPGPYTRLAVKKLVHAHERATFFVVGKSMEAWPGLLPSELKVAAIGDHTYTHPYLPGLPPSQIVLQLKRTAAMIQAQTGEHVDLFRAPYAAFDSTVDDIAKRLGLLNIDTTIDSRDSLGANWTQIIKNVEAGLHPGSIILMHENHGQTIRALTTLLPVLHRRHLRSVTLPELFALDPPSVAQIRRGLAGCFPNGRVPAPGAD
jgi:peptidoglycan/xylan/chitin deacetylase (PgdA/CDA1 family)